jgi:dolichol-phosphate mannosyltransferase
VNRLVNQAIRLLFGFRYNDVTNAFKLYRRHVIEGLQPKEMGSRYLFIVLYCLIEKWLSAGDYRRREVPAEGPARPGPTAPRASRAEPERSEARDA